MKKILMAAIFAVMSVAASAQLYVGGGVGFQYNNYKPKEGSSVSKTQFSIKPEVGYYFNDNVAAGLRFGMGYIDNDGADATTFCGEIYGRYDFLHTGNFTLGGELGLGIDTYGKNAGAGFTVALRPVAQFAVNDNVSFIGRANLFSYTKDNKDAGDDSRIGLGILNGNSTVELGIQIKF